MGIWSATIAILVVICGVLAAAECVVRKRPEAAEIIAKLKPYQSILGVITCLWGLWSFLWALINLRHASHFSGGVWVWWITYLLISIVAVGLGFLLGFEYFSKKFLSGNEATRQKGEKLLAKISPYRIPLGKAGILLGIWAIISIIIWVPVSTLFVGVMKSIVLLIISVLAAAGFIAQKKPEAGKALEKLMPYQGIIGILACLAGILAVVYALRIVGDVSDISKGGIWVWWITFLVVNLFSIVLGFLLGFPLLKKYLCPNGQCSCDVPDSSDSAEASAEGESCCEPANPPSGEDKIQAIVQKLSGLQIKLGLAGIALAVWGFIASLIWAPADSLTIVLFKTEFAAQLTQAMQQLTP